MNLTRTRDDEEQDEIVEEKQHEVPCIQDLVLSSLKRFEASSIEIANPSSSSSATGSRNFGRPESLKEAPQCTAQPLS
jgi:hypothetical protein